MLTQKAKYAIKALVYLSQQKSLVRTQDIADNASIPNKFLESILLELKVTNWFPVCRVLRVDIRYSRIRPGLPSQISITFSEGRI